MNPDEQKLFFHRYDYDVALLKLSTRIDLKNPDSPTPVCLPDAENYSRTYEGQNPWVVGKELLIILIYISPFPSIARVFLLRMGPSRRTRGRHHTSSAETIGSRHLS